MDAEDSYLTMTIKLNLTDEHIKLIPFFFFQNEGDNMLVIDKRHLLNLGAHLLDDMAAILGYTDKAIEGTENDPDGRAYPDDVEEHLLSIHKYIVDNLFYIESLIHQTCITGGITAGTYSCKAKDLIWSKKD